MFHYFLRKRYDDTYACSSVFASLWGASYPDLSTGNLQGGQASNQKVSEFQNADLSANNLAGGYFVDRPYYWDPVLTPMTLYEANVTATTVDGSWSNPGRWVTPSSLGYLTIGTNISGNVWQYDLGQSHYLWQVTIDTHASYPLSEVWLRTSANGTSWQSQMYNPNYDSTYPAPSTNYHVLPSPGLYRYIQLSYLDSSQGTYLVIDEIDIYKSNQVFTNAANLRMG